MGPTEAHQLANKSLGHVRDTSPAVDSWMIRRVPFRPSKSGPLVGEDGLFLRLYVKSTNHCHQNP